jgi:hypothetical protein
LDIPVLASYYENKMTEKNQWVFTIEKSVARIEPQVFENSNNFQSTKVLKLVRADYSLENYQA